MEKTPRVQLVLNLGDEKPNEPHILKATKRLLHCEFDGMVFKQPREELPAENTPVNRGGSGGPQASAARPACDTAEGGPSHRGPHSELAALCTSLFEAEARGAETGGDAQVAAALRDICVRLCADGAALDSIGGGACRVQPPPQRGHSGGALSPAVAALVAMEEEVEKGDYQLDLEARKAGLRSRLAGYEQEIADWERLVQEAEQYSGEPGTGAEAAGEAGSPESDAAEPAEVAALRKMHVDLHRHLTMQTEGLCKLVGDVEELVDRANRTAHSLQAEYHQEKFRAFPHVDSPARLIREIVKPPPRRAAQQQQQQ